MCGLNGIVSSEPIDLAALSAMTATIHYRGPDGTGHFVLGAHSADTIPGPFKQRPASSGVNVGLGHRRLAIIDLSADGLQPFEYDEDHVLVFNGEIYNYLEVRAELEQLGRTFRTQTDTEVACAALAHWGLPGLERLRGMWAMAWLEQKARKLTLIRDRFGIKPLYYTHTSAGVTAFGSEAKQLIPFLPTAPRLNSRTAAEFLHYGISDHGADTFIHGIQELLAGHLCEVDLTTGKLSAPRRWYSFPASKPPATASPLAEFKQLFVSSVREHLRADVPIGSCLSGGLDSSSIVSTVHDLKRESTTPQLTFSFIPVEKAYSEEKYIRLVLAQKNIRSVTVTSSAAELTTDLEDLVYHQDFPFASTSIFAQWAVFAAAKKNAVKIMLDGQGADEILGGYHAFFKMHLYSLFRRLKWGAFYRQLRALRVHGYGLKFALESIVLGCLPVSLESLLRSLVRSSRTGDYFHGSAANPRSYRGHGISDMRSLSVDQITRSNLPMLLRFEDRNSMAHGIEARVPFLDHRLVELSLALGDEWRVQGPETKSILRQTMAHELPPEITHRIDKMGFVSPEESWMRAAGPEVLASLREIQAECSQLIKEKIVTDFSRFLDGGQPYDQVFWRVLSFGLWRRRFNVLLS